MKPLNELIICIDFDGTVVTHEYPGIGREIGAAPVLKRLVEAGARLILWTMRSGIHLEEAKGWFRDHGIPLFGCQRNPEQDTWTDSPKAYAHLYIDDAAFGCPLEYFFPDERPFVDWDLVEKGLFPS